MSKPIANLKAIFRRSAAPLDAFRRPGAEVLSTDAPALRPPSGPRSWPRLPVKLDPRDALERARALTGRSIGRGVTTASIEGPSLRLLTFANHQVQDWVAEPIVERAARGGQINDPVALGSAVDATFERLSLSRHHVAWALPAFQAFCRVVELPGLRGDDLRLAVSEEIERALGAGAGDTFMYYQRLSGRVRQRQVFVLALPKTTVLPALEALDVASIHPVTMDLRPLALARAINRPNAVIVNLEEGSLDIVIVEGGTPALLRSLPLPITLSLEAAQERLLQEVDRSLAYYDDVNADHPLDPDVPLYLTGSLATGISLAERARAVTRHPIGRLTGLPVHPPDLPVADFLVNLGLALKRS